MFITSLLADHYDNALSITSLVFALDYTYPVSVVVERTCIPLLISVIVMAKVFII